MTTLIAIFIVFNIRNYLIYKIRLKALDIVERRYMLYKDDKQVYIKRIEEVTSFNSYVKMLFQLNKWKYSQFYPNWKT